MRARGLFWRSTRDTMNWTDWVKDTELFVKQVCEDAGLPVCARQHLGGQAQREEAEGQRPVKKQGLTFAGPEPQANELLQSPSSLFR